MGWNDQGTRLDEPGHFRKHRHRILMVWCEHAGGWPSQLRIHECRLQVADDL